MPAGRRGQSPRPPIPNTHHPMHRTLRVAIACTLLGACSQAETDTPPQNQQDPIVHESSIRIPGTAVSLVPPTGFLPAEEFPGYMNRRVTWLPS